MKQSEARIILVKRKTRLEEMIARYNTILQARFYIEHLGADFDDYQEEDLSYRTSLSVAVQNLEPFGRVQVIDRELVPNFIFTPTDIVVAVGQDGLVANVLKYLSKQPLIGVNPDPKRWDGVLLPFTSSELHAVLTELLHHKRPIKYISLAKAVLNDGQYLLAVNDLFIGQRTHTSARYQIQSGNVTEQQSSSGVIISTGLGYTGWLKSVLAGAAGVANATTNDPVAIQAEKPSWDANFLYFSVREPYPSCTTGSSLVFGKVLPEKPLHIRSSMAENGVIFSDGIEHDFLEFNSGIQATISVADEVRCLVQ